MNDKIDIFGERVIDRFDGTKFAFLSNFFHSPIPFVFANGGVIVVDTVEHAYQAYKTKNLVEQTEIVTARTPGLAKKLGQPNHCTITDDWEERKIGVMFSCVMLKFTLHQDLKDKLLATGLSTLIEGNTWNDRFWGTVDGIGKNNLGKILMKTRDIIRIHSL